MSPPAPAAPARLGLYGGSFDPVHLGHLLVARDALEQLGLDRMIFLPAAISPHKLDRAPGASAGARLAMLRAAVADEPRFAVDARELARTGPSYTVDTVHALRAELPPGTRLFYLIGEDNVPKLDTWHRAAELRESVQFVVCRRHAPPVGPEIVPAAPSFPVVERWVDISSTEIRKRVAAGRSIRYLVTPNVEAIIHDQRLYQTNPHPPGGTPPSKPNC